MKTIYKILMKRLVLPMATAIMAMFFAESVRVEAVKEHSHQETQPVPYSLKNGFFIISGTATTLTLTQRI